jgi:hypothetical protein
MSTTTGRTQLEEWLLERGDGLTREGLTGDTPLLERRHLTSLQLPELLLFHETVRGEPIDVMSLTTGDLRDVDTICARFLTTTPERGEAR